MNTKTLKVIAPVMIGGDLMVEGDLIEVTDREARDLVARKKAVPHKLKDGDDDAADLVDDSADAGDATTRRAGRKAKA